MAGWRVRRSKMFGPFRITATKSGLGISAGGPFGRMSVNTRGEVRKTVRVPGVGIYKTEKVAQLGEPHPPTHPTSIILAQSPRSNTHTRQRWQHPHLPRPGIPIPATSAHGVGGTARTGPHTPLPARQATFSRVTMCPRACAPVRTLRRGLCRSASCWGASRRSTSTAPNTFPR